ncbi:hypothetical protein [Roseateles sp. LYH14W]|uniref:Uncharacterized protein n=1 Tax=Pelomonas parva TaxID=3299032 RepID=A0ABW7F6M1_9BURK
MRKAYSFVARGACHETGYDVDALCVFFDTKRPVSALQFFDELTTSLQEVQALPDCVVVVAEASALKPMRGYWTESSGQLQTLLQRGAKKRVQFVKQYYFVAWSAQDGLTVDGTLPSEKPPLFKLPLQQFLQQGLNSLVLKNPVVQIAPAGHVFKHPSSTINKLFIQARELATSEAELAFVGRCLCSQLPALQSPDLAHVYIDTMGVYSFVREALTFSGSSASIHSFHSYTEISELAPPTEPYAVVISASTSGGMARRLHQEQDFEADRLMTLIDVTQTKRTGGVLVRLDDVDASYKKQLADGTEAQIELFGEHFSSKAKPPRAVTLGLPHSPRRLTEFLKQLGIGGVLPLNARSRGSSTRLVCVDEAFVGKDKALDSWLHAEISWRVPVAIDHLICAEDPGSQALAELAANKLQTLKGSAERPTVTAYGAVDAGTLSKASGVLVVQAVAGDGGLLREISRDLREFIKSDVPRHFLVGLGLPQSEETWIRLQQFLVRNASPREYGFSAWLVLPIGSDGAKTAWKAYSDLAAAAQIGDVAAAAVDKDLLERSLEQAVAAINSSFKGFFPNSQGTALGLSEGFVFFGSVFDGRIGDVTPSTAYATVAAVLQTARELANPANQLKPSGYESVVLSPENFLRFNDELLQACILRAAHPSELDYSSSPEMSRLMKEFLFKVFSRHDHGYGSAALEFGAALASGRLRLTAEDRKEVRDKAIASLAGTEGALLGLVCLIA